MSRSDRGVEEAMSGTRVYEGMDQSIQNKVRGLICDGGGATFGSGRHHLGTILHYMSALTAEKV